MGSFLGVGILYHYTSGLDLKLAFLIIALFGAVYSVLLFFVVKNKSKISSPEQKAPGEDKEKNNEAESN